MSTFDRFMFVFLVLMGLPAVLLVLAIVAMFFIVAPKTMITIVFIGVAAYYSTFYLEKKGFRF